MKELRRLLLRSEKVKLRRVLSRIKRDVSMSSADNEARVGGGGGGNWGRHRSPNLLEQLSPVSLTQSLTMGREV